MPSTLLPPRPSAWLLALTALAGSCNFVDEPAAPNLCLVTVTGLSDPVGLAWLPAAAQGATAMTERMGLGVQPDSAGEGQAVAAEAVTALERARSLGFETAAFLTHPEWLEESGHLAGAFHGADRELLDVLYPEDPWSGAVRETRAFLERKLPRPLEDGCVTWLHLELEAIESTELRERYFEAALEGLQLSMEKGPCRLVVATGNEQGVSLRTLSTVANESSWTPVTNSEPPPPEGLFPALIDGLKPFGVRPE